MRKQRAGRWKFSVQDIAQASGRGIWSVRKDRQRGKFNPTDLRSLSEYVMKSVRQDVQDAVYLRRGRKAVVKTVEFQMPNGCIGLVDLDENGNTVGIELVWSDQKHSTTPSG
jgi:uncharacterized protein YuzE